MSNVIKAYNLRYTEEKKPIDMNERAEEFHRLYLSRMQEVDNPTEIEVQEEYFQDEVELPDTAEQIQEQKNKLTEELEQMRLAAEEECRLLKNETSEECNRLVLESQKKADMERAKLLIDTRREGYNEGKRLAMEEVEQLKQQLLDQIEENRRDYEKKVDELEPDFVELLISLLTKMTGYMAEERRDIILHIIRQSMLGLESSNCYIIRVSKEDYDFVNSKKQELSNEIKDGTVEVVEDPVLERAQCTIETDTRILDCSLDVQLKNLITDLRLLSGFQTEVKKD